MTSIMRKIGPLFIFITLFIKIAHSTNHDVFTQLTPEQLQKLSLGELITKTNKIKKKVWPEVHVYVLINASVHDSVAIFSAYDYQTTYIPGLLKSSIIKQKPPEEIEVAYELKMPWPLSNSQYIHTHKLSTPKKGDFKLEWKMIKSDTAKEVRGFALFRPYKGQTLMTYYSFIDPKSAFAGIFRKFMIRDIQASVRALRTTTEKLKKSSPSLLKNYREKIDMALAGKSPY